MNIGRLNIAVVLIVCFALVFAGRTTKYEIGDAVTEFRLKNVDGRMISLSDYKTEKGVVVIFDCNTCPVSKAYNERIIALNKKYKTKGFPIVTINANDAIGSPGDSFEEMVKLAKARNYDFPYLVDETQEVGKAFGATNTPHCFVLVREGTNFRVAYIGAVDNNTRDASAADKKYLEEALDALLAKQPVPTEKTKAVGCGIKYRNS